MNAVEAHFRPPVPGPARFALGQVVGTPGALRLLARYGLSPQTLIARHAAGDFGDINQQDWQANVRALSAGGRLVSAYAIGPDAVIWIITEGDRSATTLLLPSEY